LLLDGHARILAAELEGIPLSHALVMWRSVEKPNHAEWAKEEARRYERASGRFSEWNADTSERMNRHLVAAFSPTVRCAMTLASTRKGLLEEFKSEVALRLAELGKPSDHPMLSDT
jgi:hypothetical protein